MTEKHAGRSLSLLTLIMLSLAVVLFVHWRESSGGSHSLGREAIERPSEISSDLDEPSARVVGSPRESVRHAIVSDSNPTPEKESKSVPLIERRPLLGTVVDLDQQLLPGVRVELCISGSPEGLGLDFTSRLRVQVVETTESDGDGSFSFELPIGVPHLLRVPANEAAGRATVELSPCFAGQEVTLRVPLAGTLRGVIVQSKDFRPVENSLVRLWGEQEHPHGPVHSDLSGHFRLGGLPPGSYTCQVFPIEHQRPASLELNIKAGETSEVRIEVSSGCTLRGRITDAINGKPIEDASIREGYALSRAVVKSDAGGDYVLHGAGGKGDTSIYVSAPGYSVTEARAPSAGEGDVWLDFALTRGRVAVGRVVDSAGTPLAGMRVAAAASGFRGIQQRVDWCSTESDSQGRFEISGIREDQRHVLQLQGPGYGTRVYNFPNDEAQRERIEFGDVELLPACRIEGRVRFDDETPVAHALVQLDGSNSDRTRFGQLDPSSSVNFYVARRERQADENGGFQFGSLPDGNWSLVASAPSVSGEATGSVQLEAGEELGWIELTLSRGSTLAGRVLSPDGRGIAMASIIAHESEGQSLEVMSDGNGAFQILGLTAASYDLQVRAPRDDSRVAERKPRLFGTWISDVAVGQQNLEIKLVPAVGIAGQVLQANGEPLPYAWVQLQDNMDHFLNRVVADETGHFKIEAPAERRVEISACATVAAPNHVTGRRVEPQAQLGRLELETDAGEPIIIRVP